MAIKLCMPFYNEHLISGINIREAAKWVDEIHVTECDRSFKFTPHPYEFQFAHEEKVVYHKLDGNKYYKKSRKLFPYIDIHPITKWMKHYYFKTNWYNDAVSRNFSLWNCDYDDKDILILSDIDEIIDYKYLDEIIEVVKKTGIATINLYFTVFYFNLLCPNFSGAPHYSYRTFIVRGDVMRKRFFNDSDYLRKMGERGKLINEVPCLYGYKGWHHSWLGDEYFIMNKLNSYAHSIEEHASDLSDSNGNLSIESIRNHLRLGKSIFKNSDLIIDNTLPLLEEVNELKVTNPQYFITK